MRYTRIIIAALFAAIALPLAAQTQEDSLIFAAQDWGWQDLGKGAQAGYAEMTIFGAPEAISVIKYPAKKYRTSLIDAQGELADGTDALAIKAGAKIAANGSYFDMRRLLPITYISVDHKQLGATTQSELFRCTGVLAIKGNGHKLDIMKVDSTKFDTWRKNYKYVIATGPILIKDGVTIPHEYTGTFTTRRHPRTIVGKDADGYVYFIVIDGRWKEQSVGATIPETAAIARYFGLVDALNFDGGGSSTVWSEQTGIINHPNDNGKWDHDGARKVPNCIIVK